MTWSTPARRRTSQSNFLHWFLFVIDVRHGGDLLWASDVRLAMILAEGPLE